MKKMGQCSRKERDSNNILNMEFTIHKKIANSTSDLQIFDS